MSDRQSTAAELQLLRAEIKQLRVLGNQRLTSGGQIKRAKPKQKSIKKRQAD